MALETISASEQPKNGTTITFKIEDTAKGGRLEIKVEHTLDPEIGDAEANVAFVEKLYADLHGRLEPHREERPPR